MLDPGAVAPCPPPPAPLPAGAIDRPILFARGLPGFPGARSFVLRALPRPHGTAWLLVATGPEPAALATVPLDRHEQIYAPADLAIALAAADIALDDLLLLLVLRPAGPAGPARVNLRAPILIDARARRGVQAILQAERYPIAAPLDSIMAPRSAAA